MMNFIYEMTLFKLKKEQPPFHLYLLIEHFP